MTARVLDRLRDFVARNSPAARLAADRSFLDKALEVNYTILPAAQTLQELMERSGELAAIFADYAHNVAALPAPHDRRLRRVRRILERGIGRRQELLSYIERLGRGDPLAAEQIARSLRLWKEQTDRVAELTRSYAIDYLTKAAEGARENS
jgi:predicted O-linked N-acetylglucosamine transferase (SPINDLY family)